MLGRFLRTFLAKSSPRRAPVSAEPLTQPEPSVETVAVAPGLPFMIRPAVDADLPALADVFRAAITHLAARDYEPGQLAAWCAKADDRQFVAALKPGVTILAEHHGQPIAFAQLEPADCVRMLYVHPDWSGLGIATLLCQYLEDEARIGGNRELETHASHTARRFFESMGYKAEQEEDVRLGEVVIGRTRMRKRLGA